MQMDQADKRLPFCIQNTEYIILFKMKLNSAESKLNRQSKLQLSNMTDATSSIVPRYIQAPSADNRLPACRIGNSAMKNRVLCPAVETARW
jgi:hypothetical protein